MMNHHSIRLTLILIAMMLTACGGGSSDLPTRSSQGQLILDNSHGDAGSAWGKEDCDSCHALKVIHKNAPEITRVLAEEKNYATCTGCHGSNGTAAIRQCTICHNDEDLPAAPLTYGGKVHHFYAEDTEKLNDRECVICHEASDMNGRFDINADLTHFPDVRTSNARSSDRTGLKSTYSSEAEFCQSCHNRDHQQLEFPIIGRAFDDPLVAIEDDYRFFDYHGFRDGSGQGTYNGLRAGYIYPQVVSCSDCHAMHGTSNELLIIDSSAKGARGLDPVFRATPYSVHIGENGDYGQLCVLCHSMETLIDDGDKNAGNGLSGVHMVGQDCRDCHTHGEATQVGL